MKRIEHYVLPEQTNSLYQEEAISSIGLTKDVAEKINELIDEINAIKEIDLRWKQEQEGTIRKGVLFMKDNLLNSLNDLMVVLRDSGFVDDRIAYHARTLSQRLDNLNGQLTEGTTSMDAEIIDSRVGYDGETYATSGTATREQFRKTLETLKTHINALPFEILGNLVDFETVTYNKMIDNDGNEVDSNPLAVSDFIKVDPLKRYKTKSAFSSAGVAYDINKNYIGKIYDIPAGTPTESELTFEFIHKNTAYVRLNMLASSASAKSFYFIEEGKENELPCVKIPNLSIDGRTYLSDIPTDKKWQGKKWACIGDSLTESNDRADKNYHDFIAEETGITVVNMGESGTGYKRKDDVNASFYQRISNVPLDSDVVTIFGSGNDLADWEIGTPLDTGTDTLCGCINTTLDNLFARMPYARVGIITPTPWQSSKPGIGSQMEHYVDTMIELCKMRRIPYLDLYRCSNLRPWTEEGRNTYYSKDNGNGVHPDENGHKAISPAIREFIATLI